MNCMLLRIHVEKKFLAMPSSGSGSKKNEIWIVKKLALIIWSSGHREVVGSMPAVVDSFKPRA